MKKKEKYLYYLNELSDYKVDDKYADVRDWVVKDATMRPIGTVTNLLVNKISERVVYLDVEVEPSIIDAKHDPYKGPANSEVREFINEKGENHIIIPIGLVDINMAEEYVFTEEIDHKTFAETKRIRRDTPIVRDYENAVLDSYGRRYVHTPANRKADAAEGTDEVVRESRMDKIKDRHSIGEYRDDDSFDKNFKAGTQQRSNENDRDQAYDEQAEREFYGRSEFDDSRFHRKKE
ncbi:photosystem reaction center subunit H [Pricia sp. S334]|uniref:Photosystem reaction center subunit H n=1 Tax=Pricia mediterranea TaxID=3076079 RepID=A0ABU3L1J0_9FLAO|nr:photosystem reaction center subunit H [Pricia sp. S334]MDT7827600.1 photosystem reaction center subunit H [Pricia sp. S334]